MEYLHNLACFAANKIADIHGGNTRRRVDAGQI